MICWLFLGNFFFFTLKDFIFLRNLFSLDEVNFFIFSLLPLVIYIVLNIIFCSSIFYQKFFYRFFFFLVRLIVCMTFFCSSSFMFFLILELRAFPILFLILNFSKGEDKFSSVVFILLINFFGSMPFIFFRIFTDKLVLFFFNIDSEFYIMSFVLLRFFTIILIRKIPIFFFHFWLTKAHVRASGSCSILLARIMLKLGTFGLLKFSPIFSFLHSKISGSFFSLALWGSFLMTLIMRRFFDSKLLIACSSILHISLIGPFCFNLESYSFLGSLFMMVGHGLVSYYLFYLVTLLYETSFSRSYDSNKRMESVSKLVTIVLFVYVFLNLGVPPLINFLREIFFLLTLFKISTLFTLFFFLILLIRILFRIFFLRKSSFGKKANFIYGRVEDMSFLTSSLFYFSFLIFYFILCVCFYSLVKTLPCGGKEDESNHF